MLNEKTVAHLKKADSFTKQIYIAVFNALLRDNFQTSTFTADEMWERIHKETIESHKKFTKNFELSIRYKYVLYKFVDLGLLGTLFEQYCSEANDIQEARNITLRSWLESDLMIEGMTADGNLDGGQSMINETSGVPIFLAFGDLQLALWGFIHDGNSLEEFI